MTKLTELALKVDEIAQRAGDDPFELYRAAVSGERIVITDDDACDEIEKLIEELSARERIMLDAIVFSNATGQSETDVECEDCGGILLKSCNCEP